MQRAIRTEQHCDPRERARSRAVRAPWRRWLVAVASITGAVAGAGAAQAATLDVAAGTLIYTPGGGIANQVTLSVSGANYQLVDTGETISLNAGALSAGCTVNGPADTATCPDANVTSLVVSLGDGGDQATLQSTNDTTSVDAGSGTDTVASSQDASYTLAPTQLTIAPANDVFTLAGFEQADLTGGAGANSFTVTAWVVAATLSGSGGTDTIVSSNDSDFTLSDATLVRGATTFTLAGIESATLTGGIGGNQFTVSGWTGSATLDGGAGTDTIRSLGVDVATTSLSNASLTRTGSGTVTLSSASFEQASLSGGAGVNTISASGFSGPVTLDGGGSGDTLTGGAGNDTVTDTGGSGTDVLTATGDVSFTLTAGQLTGLGTDTLAGIEQVQLTGGGGANTLTALGFGGTVRLDGSGGNDTLTGTAGSDMLIGGAGTDRVVESGGAFTLTNVQLTGNGTDTLNNDIEQATLTGAGTIDASGFTIAGGSTNLVGSAGVDTIIGSPNADVITGAGGNDTLTGGGGTDRLQESGVTNATLTNAQFSDPGLGTDTLATIEAATLTGGSGNDTINASAFQAGAVTLDGGGGDDTLSGGAASDTFTGGPGNDTLAGNAGTADRLIENSLPGAIALSNVAFVGNGSDSLSGIEQATLTGTGAAETFSISGWTGIATLDGGGADDGYAVALAGAGTVSIVDSGGTAADAVTVATGGGADAINLTTSQIARAGEVVTETVGLTGIEGRVIDLGEGNDSATVAGMWGTILGGGGDDAVSVTAIGSPGLAINGGAGSDRTSVVFGGLAGPLTLTDSGSAGSDALVVPCDVGAVITATKVTFDGQTVNYSGIEQAPCAPAAPPAPPPPPPGPGPGPGTPKCTKTGTKKDDVLRGTPKRDVLCGLGGDDTLIGLGGDDVLIGGDGDDKLEGSKGKDTLQGGAGNDTLDGGKGKDILEGGKGKDTLIGLDGEADTLDGGSGKDSAEADSKLDKAKGVERLAKKLFGK